MLSSLYKTLQQFNKDASDQMKSTEAETLGYSDKAVPAEIKFPERKDWPKASETATEREKEVLGGLVELIEKQAKGIYGVALEKHHKAGNGVREAGPILDAEFRKYLQNPEDNPYKDMNEFLKDKTPNEKRLVYSTLVEINKPLTGKDKGKDASDYLLALKFHEVKN